MNKPVKTFFLFVFLVSYFHGYAQKEQAAFDYGKIVDSTYVNTFFKVKMKLPHGWVIQSKEQVDNLTKKGRELISGDNENMKAILKASEINTANLLTMFKYEQGAAVEFNPSLMLIAENMKDMPGVKTGADYLFHARRLILQSQMKYDSLDQTFGKKTIGGKEFYLMNAFITHMNLHIHQVYYSTVLNGFTYNAVLSFTSKEHQLELENVLHKSKFD